MILCNPVLIQGQQEPRLITNGATFSLHGPAVIRVEPGFVMTPCTFSVEWSLDGAPPIRMHQAVSRQTVAAFVRVPAEGFRIAARLKTSCREFEFQLERVARETAPSLRGICYAREMEGAYSISRDALVNWPFDQLLLSARSSVDQLGLEIVAVTGSVGKTTTKEILAHALRGQSLYASTDSWNFPHETLAQLHLNCSWARTFVFEVAITRFMSEMGRALSPKVVVLTHAGMAHTDVWRSASEVACTKALLVEGLPPGGAIVSNGDVPELVEAVAGAKARLGPREHFSYSEAMTHPTADVIVEERLGESESHVVICDRLRRERLDLAVPLGVGGSSLAAAYLALRALRPGITVGESAERLRGLTNVPFRLRLIRSRGKRLVDDSYNANPISYARFFSVFGRLAATATRPVLILGGMAELGPCGDEANRALVAQALRCQHGKVVLLGTLIPDDISPGDRVTRYHSVHCLAADISGLVHDSDLIGVKGSWSTGAVLATAGILQVFAEAEGSTVYGNGATEEA